MWLLSMYSGWPLLDIVGQPEALHKTATGSRSVAPDSAATLRNLVVTGPVAATTSDSGSNEAGFFEATNGILDGSIETGSNADDVALERIMNVLFPDDSISATSFSNIRKAESARAPVSSSGMPDLSPTRNVACLGR